MKKTVVVRVERCAWTYTTLLVDMDDKETWEMTTQRAIERCERNTDVEWGATAARPPHFIACFQNSQDSEDLVHLLESSQRPAGLDGKEEQWLKEVEPRVGVSGNEVGRYNKRRFSERRAQGETQEVCGSDRLSQEGVSPQKARHRKSSRPR